MKTTPVLAPEILVPRFGDYMVNQGLITKEQLDQALELQHKSFDEGEPKLLGQSLIELNFISRENLDRTITEQIIALRQALEDSNKNLERRVELRTEELRDAIQKLSELNQMKANFVANISHELRTPLTHIKGYVELLASESLGSLNQEQKKALDVSLRSTNRLKNLIDDLILFSLASRGEMTLTFKPTPVYSLASRILEYAIPRAQEKKLKFIENVDANLPPIQADEQKISWALNQLLDNAIKFTDSGSVTLSVKRDAYHQNMALVTVSDTGVGIDKNKTSEIYEPFHQLDNSTTRKYGGTGLGLALVRQIIQAHGSELIVESVVGKGTTFSFLILFETNNDLH